MDDGKILFPDTSCFEQAPEAARGFGSFSHQRHSAGFPIQAIDHLGRHRLAQIQAHSANETGIHIPFGGMADQPGGFVHHQEFVIFKNDVQKGFHKWI